MSSEVGILELTSLHLWMTIDKKRKEKAQRFARIKIDGKGNKTFQINAGEGWSEVPEIDYYTKVEEVRSNLIEKLKKELLEKSEESHVEAYNKRRAKEKQKET